MGGENRPSASSGALSAREGIVVECSGLSPRRRVGFAGRCSRTAGIPPVSGLALFLALAPAHTTGAPAVEPKNAVVAERAAEPEHATPHPDPAPLTSPSPVASPPAAPVFPRSLGPTYERQLLLDLPGQGLWSLFETIESTAILDRMDGGGLYVGEAGLLGVRGSSWTQASWLMGDLDITDPERTGTPLFFADPDDLEAVEIAAGLSPANHRGIGPGIDLVLRRPGNTWRRSLHVSQAPSSLQQARGAAIARLDSFASGRFRLDGPLIKDRLGLFVSGSLARGARRERSDPRPLTGREAGLLAHLVYVPTPRDEVRFVTGFQGVTHPYEGRARFGARLLERRDRPVELALVDRLKDAADLRAW